MYTIIHNTLIDIKKRSILHTFIDLPHMGYLI